MAARKRRGTKENPWPDDVREKIRSSMLVNRLVSYALNEDDPQGNEVKLETGQVRAIEILLKKTLPDLQSTEINANVSATVTLEGKTEDELQARIDELTKE